MSKIYIAGKIAGEPKYKDPFAAEADKQREAGHIVLNQAELPEGMSPADYMRICLAMIDAADKVVLLPNYQQSPGARLEREYCQYTGKPVECLEQEEGDSQMKEAMLEIDRMTAPKRAIEKWGKEAQIRQCMEECAELIQALNKYLRVGTEGGLRKLIEAKDHVKEEMADVCVMLDQMEEIFGDSWGEYDAAVDHLVKLLKDGDPHDPA